MIIETYVTCAQRFMRKAYEKQREEQIFGHDDYDKVTYRGEKVLWPIILFQVNALRHFASFQPTTKEQQSNLYRLESCIEDSLLETDPLIGQQCIEWLNGPTPLTTDYHTLYLSEVVDEFVSGAGGKRRFKKLPKLLGSCYIISPEYRAFCDSIEARAKELGCTVHELHDFSETPEFKW